MSGREDEADRSEGRKDPRRDRLAEQLRANLQRRKAQTRARRAGDADQRPEGLGDAGRGSADDDPS